MVTELKSLIIQQIKQVYNNVKVYDEPIKQGLKTPAFLVLIIHDHHEKQLYNNSKWEYTINVTYFPEDDQSYNTECDEVSETFKLSFRYIGNQFHVNKLDMQKQDGTLVITFNVKTLVKEITEETKMQTLQFGGEDSE
ncbi:phage tail terminator family protein [Cytobacillus sp. Hm23]